MNSASVNIQVQVFVWISILDIYLGVIARSYGNSKFNFEELPNYFPQWLYHFTYWNTSILEFLHIFVNTYCFLYFFNCGYSDVYASLMICISLIQMMWNVSSCACWTFVYHLWGNVYSSPLPLLSVFLSFSCGVVRILYIFWVLGPYQMHDLQIFSSIL